MAQKAWSHAILQNARIFGSMGSTFRVSLAVGRASVRGLGAALETLPIARGGYQRLSARALGRITEQAQTAQEAPLWAMLRVAWSAILPTT